MEQRKRHLGHDVSAIIMYLCTQKLINTNWHEKGKNLDWCALPVSHGNDGMWRQEDPKGSVEKSECGRSYLHRRWRVGVVSRNYKGCRGGERVVQGERTVDQGDGQ